MSIRPFVNHKHTFECEKCKRFCARYIIGNGLFSKIMGDERCVVNCKNADIDTYYHAPSNTEIERCRNYESNND